MKLYLLVTLIGLLHLGCSKQPMRIEKQDAPARIVSMAPSATETIYAAGGGHRLVGLTRFCVYPDELMHLPRIGGLTDTNYEYLFRLQPDLAVIQKEHHAAPERLDQLGIAHLSIDTSSIAEIYESIVQLGDILQTSESAQTAVAGLQSQVSLIVSQTKGAPQRRVLISVSRDSGSGRLSDVYIAGSNTIYNEILSLIGAVNVYSGQLEYPKLSVEGIIRLNPDVIIDLQASTQLAEEKILADWHLLGDVSAVQEGEVYILDSDYVTIPGPRFIHLMKDIAKAIYPKHIGEVERDE